MELGVLSTRAFGKLLLALLSKLDFLQNLIQPINYYCGQNLSLRDEADIDIIHKWLPLHYSFFLVQVSL